jgi:HNH endonuclease
MSPDFVPTCIYCKRTDVQFNREHVIPEAFGTYGADTMLLNNNEVCSDCNTTLGRDLDQILSRDSFEAMIRANSLPQEQGAGERFSPRRAWLHVPDKEPFGVLRGARMAIDPNTRRPTLLDQIIVRSKDGGLRIFLQHDFPQADARIFHDLPPHAIQVIGLNREKVEVLMQMVRDRGISLTDREAVDPPAGILQSEIRAVTEGRIDVRTWRAIAKIAFNYLAYHECAQHVLSDKFEPIRDFITGRRTDRKMVQLLNAPILAHETSHWRAFEGHLVAYQDEGRMLRGKVSLYNSITYEVMLCGDLGLYYTMKKGHAFDPVQGTVSTIASLPFQVLLPAEAVNLLSFFPLD